MTLSIAYRNMRTGKARIAFSIAGVAVAVLLLSFILALYRGWNDGLVTYIDNSEADIWVAPYGADSFFTPGFFSDFVVDEIKKQPGVIAASPLLYRPVKLRTGTEAYDTWVVGFQPEGLGGPSRVKKGARTPARGEIIIDEVLADIAGIGIGDRVDIGGTEMTVSGISSGGNVVFAQISFIHQDDARAQFLKLIAGSPAEGQLTRIINLALVQTEPGREEEAAAAIKKNVIGAVQPFLPKAYADESRAALQQSMLPILLLILLIAMLVGTLVMGLTVYTSVLEKEREFGVIKALGVRPTGLLRVILEQALVCCLAGFVVGLLGALLAGVLAREAVPQFIVIFRWSDTFLVLGAAILMSVIASLVPAGRIVRVDALTVFKA